MYKYLIFLICSVVALHAFNIDTDAVLEYKRSSNQDILFGYSVALRDTDTEEV